MDVPDTLTRTYNLTGTEKTAKVEFDYRRDIPSGQTDDKFDVQISINGGAFTTIGNIGATGNASFVDSTYQHFTFDVSSAVNISTVALRFSVGDNVDDGDVVYVDNVKLSYPTTAGATQTINYAENSAVGILPPQITDADHNAVIQSAMVKLTSHQDHDLLSITGTLPGSIIASGYDSGTGVLTLTGTGTLAQYQDALSHILFSNTSNNPSTADRTLTITVNDGMADSNLATETIHVTAINDAPTATADHVITNFGNNNAFQIPDSVLIANDTDPDNTLAQLSINGVSGVISGTAGHGAGATAVTFTDNNNNGSGSGGSFNYTLTDGGTIPSTAQVTVADVSGNTLTGSGANDIFIAKAGGSTMNGNGGNDVFIGNTGADIMNGSIAGNDTFVFKATTDSHSGAGNFDTINNFTHGSDHLDFTAIANATHYQGNITAVDRPSTRTASAGLSTTPITRRSFM